MSRFFAPISKDEFVDKIMSKVLIADDDDGDDSGYDKYYNLELDNIKDPLKVSFDFENWEWVDKYHLLNYPCGYFELPNGMNAWAINAGGDWEWPVCFIIYWDGKQLRLYIPTKGNVWNRISKSAFGNEEPEVEQKGIQKLIEESNQWATPGELEQIKIINFKSNYVDLTVFSSKEAIIQDIMERILPKK